MVPLDEKLFRDTGYGEALKRKDGSLYYIAYRGTDDAADIWSYIISPVKDKRKGDSHQMQKPRDGRGEIVLDTDSRHGVYTVNCDATPDSPDCLDRCACG